MLKNVNSYDYLRVITIYSVVLLHTTAPLLYLFNVIPTYEWITGDAFGSLVRWCVPIFFMLSGTFLLDPNKNETIKDFFNGFTVVKSFGIEKEVSNAISDANQSLETKKRTFNNLTDLINSLTEVSGLGTGLETIMYMYPGACSM